MPEGEFRKHDGIDFLACDYRAGEIHCRLYSDRDQQASVVVDQLMADADVELLGNIIRGLPDDIEPSARIDLDSTQTCEYTKSMNKEMGRKVATLNCRP